MEALNTRKCSTIVTTSQLLYTNNGLLGRHDVLVAPGNTAVKRRGKERAAVSEVLRQGLTNVHR
jgi:hypothetical protein